MKTYTISILLIMGFLLKFAGAQNSDLIENERYIESNLEFWFTVDNEQQKEKYSRYEVTINCRYVGSCSYFRPLRTDRYNVIQRDNKLATFNCINATGQRLTNKHADLFMPEITVPFSRSYKDCESGKYKTEILMVPAGFMIEPGAAFSRREIFIVPLGERPRIQANVYTPVR